MPADRRNKVSAEELHRKKASANATASLVLGIISIVLCPVPVMLVAAVVGLMLEKESERWDYHYFQTPARVLCIIGIILCSLAIAGVILFFFVFRILSRG